MESVVGGQARSYARRMAHAPPTAADPSVLETLQALMEEVRALREELGTNRSPWLTTAQAAEYLNVSADTLKRLARKHGHEDGGPVDVGDGRKLLRWNRETLDVWFRRASRIAAPKVKAVRRPERKAEAPRERFDWSSI